MSDVGDVIGSIVGSIYGGPIGGKLGGDAGTNGGMTLGDLFGGNWDSVGSDLEGSINPNYGHTQNQGNWTSDLFGNSLGGQAEGAGANEALQIGVQNAKRGGGILGRKKLASGGTSLTPPEDQYENSVYHGSGLFNSLGAGRTDIHNRDVPAGGYVVPADVVSGLAEGNTMGGSSVIDKMFSTGPYGVKPGTGPDGMKLKGGHGHADFPRLQGSKAPPAPRVNSTDDLGLGLDGEGKKRGGLTGKKKSSVPGGPPVPVVVAGGEHYIPPEAIEQKFGDLDRGHKILDNWVVARRQHNIKELKKLPGPKK